MPSTFIIVGRACSGKSTLATWLCRRLPQPVAGLRTLCTGRDEAGALFSLQDLATGQRRNGESLERNGGRHIAGSAAERGCHHPGG